MGVVSVQAVNGTTMRQLEMFTSEGLAVWKRVAEYLQLQLVWKFRPSCKEGCCGELRLNHVRVLSF